MRSYAVIGLMGDVSEVPIKFNIIHRTPGFVLEWYIKKFNPFTVQDTQALGEHGYNVRLPVTYEDMQARRAHFLELAERTLRSLRDYGVEIVLPPVGAEAFPDVLPIADGRYVFPYFLMQAIDKALKLAGKSVRDAEIVLIDGERELTLCVLENIYAHINYLTVITDGDYEDTAAEIYGESGLNLRVTDFSRTALTTADVIISTRADNKFDYYYKRGAIYFELAQGGAGELAVKRNDILPADGLRLSGADGQMSLEVFECALYVASREYRIGRRVAERVRAYGYTVTGLCLRGKPLTGAQLMLRR